MKRIDESGELSDEDEEELGKAIAEMVDDFGPDFDEEGQPLEEGESDRIKYEEERAQPAATTDAERTRTTATTRRRDGRRDRGGERLAA